MISFPLDLEDESSQLATFVRYWCWVDVGLLKAITLVINVPRVRYFIKTGRYQNDKITMDKFETFSGYYHMDNGTLPEIGAERSNLNSLRH